MSETVTVTAAPLVVTDKPEEVGRAIKRATGVMSAAVALRVLNRLIQATPKDTGFAKACWIASVGIPSKSTGGNKQSVDTTLQNASKDRLRFYEIEQGVIYITNNTDYIHLLNGGSSTKAPPGFIETALADESVQFGISVIKL